MDTIMLFRQNKYLLPAIGATIVGSLVLVLILLGQSSPVIISAIAIGIIGIALPHFILEYLKFVDIRETEAAYPNFLRDLTQSVSSGMTIPQAITVASQTEYRALTKYIKKLNTNLAWGAPFPEAWARFTTLLKDSEIISRINGIILESFHSGGDISDVLEALSEDVDIIKRMEADKRAMMAEHLAVMYVVFGVFLSIIVILYKILLPILYLQRFGAFSGLAFRSSELLGVEYFKNLFFIMTLVQAGSLGVIAGQITEEKMIAGFKHIVIMLAVGIAVFFIFIFPSKLTFDMEVTPQSLGIGQSFTVAGRVFYDAMPSGGAQIEIQGPTGELTSLFANSLGEFSTNLQAPTQPGSYYVTVMMTYGSESRTETRTIVVS
jgi:pilus assembly protein TadC